MAKASLVKASEQQNLPAVYNNLPAVNVDTDTVGVPYVGFLATTPNSADKAANIRAACPGIGEGDPYLSMGGTYRRLDPLKFHLLAAEQFWCERDQTGNTIRTTREKPDSWKSPFKEEVIAALLVYAGDDVIPALCSFRTTKSGGIHPAVNALRQVVEQPGEWGALSADHQASLALNLPFSRFTTTVSMRKDTAKGSGNPMFLARGSVKPITAGEWKVLKDALESPSIAEAVNGVTVAFKSRVAELAGKVVNA